MQIPRNHFRDALKQGRVQGEVPRGATEEDVMHLATRADETDAA